MPKENTEKLQKVLARLGLGSRREMEVWISAGRTSVNGQVAKLGDRVSKDDQLRVDGKRISKTHTGKHRTRVLMYHKPAGEVTTRKDEEGRKTVFDRLPNISYGRWIAIGRLDLNTSGLLLFTNNGDLANKLMHPSNEIEREYAVRIFGSVSDNAIKQLLSGVELEDGVAKFEHINPAGGEGRNSWYHVTLKEGRNREVRRLWESQDLIVSRLHRIRYGNISLDRNLKLGRWEQLEDKDTADLMTSVGLTPDEKRVDKKSLYSAGKRHRNKPANSVSPWGASSAKRNKRKRR